MRFLKLVIIKLSELPVLITIVMYSLFFTTPGADVLLRIVGHVVPGQLNVARVDGNLMNGVSLFGVHYRNASIHLDMPHVHLIWKRSLNIKAQGFVLNQAHINQFEGQFGLSENYTQYNIHCRLDEINQVVPDTNIQLKTVDLSLVLHEKAWQLNGSIIEGKGQKINLKGQGNFQPRLAGQVMLDAINLPVLDTPEYHVVVSPQLKIAFEQDKVVVSGNILVPAAQLKPVISASSEHLTDDVVFVNQSSKKSALSLPIGIDVTIQVGDDVKLDAQGLHGKLGGNVRLRQSPGGVMQGDGELFIKNGKYEAYGQNLAIQQGRVIFTGATLTNPYLNVRAVRHFDNTSKLSGSNQLFDFNATNIQTMDYGTNIMVGIDVSGTVSSPKIKLFSVPSSLSQADILSLLLLGKPASQASRSGGQLLLTAVSAMNLDSGAKGMQLMSQLHEKLGLDFDLQSNSTNTNGQGFSPSDSKLVVSKSLSDRLSVSYAVGILEENSNVLILKYLLNKYFSIQVTSSMSSNGLDVLYVGHK